MGGFAWVTLATNDSYALGALVLAHSLRRVGTQHDLVALITPGVSAAMRNQLSSVFTVIQEVNVLDSRDEAHLALLERPELGITFTKLHCWRLTQYEKCVFLDADTLVLKNSDELFEREEFSAAPDPGWPDCFNSGVFVYRPSLDTFNALIKFALSKGSFDGGDQGLLNLFFSDWATKDISRHLPFIYNMVSTATYSYLPAYKQFGENAKIVHFIGANKPWLQYFDSETRLVRSPAGAEHLQPLLQMWWDIFCSTVHPSLSPEMLGLAGALAQLTLGAPRSAEQAAFEEHMRRQAWEQGNMDYMGRDSFDNIWRKISETLAQAPQKPGEHVDSAVPEAPESSPSQVSVASEKVVSSTVAEVSPSSQESTPKDTSTSVEKEKVVGSTLSKVSEPKEILPIAEVEKLVSPTVPEIPPSSQMSDPKETTKSVAAVPEQQQISLSEPSKESSFAPIVAEERQPLQASAPKEIPPSPLDKAVTPLAEAPTSQESIPKEEEKLVASSMPKEIPIKPAAPIIPQATVTPQVPASPAEKEVPISQQVKSELPVSAPPLKEQKQATVTPQVPASPPEKEVPVPQQVKPELPVSTPPLKEQKQATVTPQVPVSPAEKEAPVPQQIKPELPVSAPPLKEQKQTKAIPIEVSKTQSEVKLDSKGPKSSEKHVSEELKAASASTSPTKTKDVSKPAGKKPVEPKEPTQSGPVSPPQTPDAPPSEQAPVPPKRRGHKSASAAPGAEQGASSKPAQPQSQQTKGSKPGSKSKK